MLYIITVKLYYSYKAIGTRILDLFTKTDETGYY
jgi:hypothetical protein